MNIYEKDILSQGKDMQKALKSYRLEDYPKILAKLPLTNFKKIVFTGMGSSFFACNNAVTMLRRSGFCAYSVTASQLLHYENDSISADTLLVMVSQSGRSGEIVELCGKLKGRCFVLGLTNYADSPLALASDLVLNLNVESEQAVSTRTYLAPLMLLYITAKVFIGAWKEESYIGIEDTINALGESLETFNANSDKIEAFLGVPPYISLIARGYSLSTAEAGALFIKEVAKYPSIAFDSAQFRHGPFEMLGKDFACFIFAPSDHGYDMQMRLVNDIADRGGRVVLVTDSAAASRDNVMVIKQRYPVPELLDMINVTPLQAFADYAAKRKGLDVGVFIHSSKITNLQ